MSRRDIHYFRFLICAAVVEAAHAAGDILIAVVFIILATVHFWDYRHSEAQEEPHAEDKK